MTAHCLIEPPQSLDSFHQVLERSAGVKLTLKINDNRSTMLSLRSSMGHVKLSIHRMFLSAPSNVMEALICYIRGEHKAISGTIRSYIEDNIRKLDYSHLVDTRTIAMQGHVYDLQQVYNAVNRDYFDETLNLRITWFGKHLQKNRRRLTFGLYHEPLKLIKIHRILDDITVPAFIVEYVVYHEMLHHVCPPIVRANGSNQVHTRAFRDREVQFHHYKRAKEWIAANQERLFAQLK